MFRKVMQLILLLQKYYHDSCHVVLIGISSESLDSRNKLKNNVTKELSLILYDFQETYKQYCLFPLQLLVDILQCFSSGQETDPRVIPDACSTRTTTCKHLPLLQKYYHDCYVVP